MKLQINRQESIAIVGAGIAGLSCATHLKSLGYRVEIFEKSRGPSGRMSTRYGDGWTADHGAQYFTARDPLFINELDSWIKNNVAATWMPAMRVFEDDQLRESFSKEHRYVGLPDMSSPGRYLAKSLSVQFNQTIDQIERKNGKWLLHTKESEQLGQNFDYLILALPAPQTFELTKSMNKEINQISKAADMRGCWTVMARFQGQPALPFDAMFVNHEIISWICRNNSKPGRDGLDCWTIHANPEWSQQNIEFEKDKVTTLILNCAKKLGLNCQDAEITTHRWRYASGFMDPKPECHFNPTSKLGLCGDWLHGGRVEGAWLSGYKLAGQIIESQSNSKPSD